MVSINNINFVYPILCNYNDDYKTSFNGGTIGDLRKTNQISSFDVLIELENEDIIQLILSNRAKIILKVYCPSTKYRTIIDLNIGMNIINLKNKNINKKVVLQTLIVTNENIYQFYSDDFHPDYVGKKFDIEKGSIIAIGDIEDIYIEKDIDDLTSINSVVKIINSHINNIPMRVESEDDYIKIYLSEETYNTYAKYSKFKFLPIINSMIIIPSIMEVLDKLLVDYDSAVEEKKWYRVISKKIGQATGKEFNIDYIKNRGSFEIVQKIFDCPILESMEIIDNNYNGEK